MVSALFASAGPQQPFFGHARRARRRRRRRRVTSLNDEQVAVRSSLSSGRVEGFPRRCEPQRSRCVHQRRALVQARKPARRVAQRCGSNQQQQAGAEERCSESGQQAARRTALPTGPCGAARFSPAQPRQAPLAAAAAAEARKQRPRRSQQRSRARGAPWPAPSPPLARWPRGAAHARTRAAPTRFASALLPSATDAAASTLFRSGC